MKKHLGLKRVRKAVPPPTKAHKRKDKVSRSQGKVQLVEETKRMRWMGLII